MSFAYVVKINMSDESIRSRLNRLGISNGQTKDYLVAERCTGSSQDSYGDGITYLGNSKFAVWFYGRGHQDPVVWRSVFRTMKEIFGLETTFEMRERTLFGGTRSNLGRLVPIDSLDKRAIETFEEERR